MSMLGGCAPYDKMDDLLPANFPNLRECIELNQKRFDQAFLSSFDAIAVNALYDWYKPQHLQRFLSRAKNVAPNMPLIVFGNYITLNIECWRIAAKLGVHACGDRRFIDSEFRYEDELADVSKRAGATFVSMRKIFCQDGECVLQLGDVPFTWDKFHLSYEFSVELGHRISDIVALLPKSQASQ